MLRDGNALASGYTRGETSPDDRRTVTPAPAGSKLAVSAFQVPTITRLSQTTQGSAIKQRDVHRPILVSTSHRHRVTPGS